SAHVTIRSGKVTNSAQRLLPALRSKAMRLLSAKVALAIICGAFLSAVMSADDEQTPAATQKATKAKGANRGAAVARLLGPLDAAHAKMDADGDGKISEEEFGKFLETASNGRVKGALASQIYRTYDENHDGNLTL